MDAREIPETWVPMVLMVCPEILDLLGPKALLEVLD